MVADRSRVVARWSAGSLVWTVLVSAALLVVPTSTRVTEEATPGGGVEVTTRHLTLLESQGAAVLPVLLVAILLPVLALAAGADRRSVVLGLGVVYLVLAFLGGASVGLLYLPGAAALVMAGSLAFGAGTVRS